MCQWVNLFLSPFQHSRRSPFSVNISDNSVPCILKVKPRVWLSSSIFPIRIFERNSNFSSPFQVDRFEGVEKPRGLSLANRSQLTLTTRGEWNFADFCFRSSTSTSLRAKSGLRHSIALFSFNFPSYISLPIYPFCYPLFSSHFPGTRVARGGMYKQETRFHSLTFFWHFLFFACSHTRSHFFTRSEWSADTKPGKKGLFAWKRVGWKFSARKKAWWRHDGHFCAGVDDSWCLNRSTRIL